MNEQKLIEWLKAKTEEKNRKWQGEYEEGYFDGEIDFAFEVLNYLEENKDERNENELVV